MREIYFTSIGARIAPSLLPAGSQRSKYPGRRSSRAQSLRHFARIAPETINPSTKMTRLARISRKPFLLSLTLRGLSAVPVQQKSLSLSSKTFGIIVSFQRMVPLENVCFFNFYAQRKMYYEKTAINNFHQKISLFANLFSEFRR